MLSVLQLRIFLFTMGVLLASMSGYFSVVGLSNLFGNGIEIWIMASFLELSKIVSVSFISNKIFFGISKYLKLYIITSTILLMAITSLGVYGYLSSKYQILENNLNEIQLKKDAVNLQIDTYISDIKLIELENARINKQIENLQRTQDTKINLTDKVINNKNYNKLLNNLDKSSNKITLQNEAFNNLLIKNLDIIKNKKDSVQSLVLKLNEIKINETKNSDVNSLKFISSLFNIQFKYIINVLIIVLVVVFDPLAISLLISANLIKDEKILEGKLDKYVFLK